ncbi:MAG: hypothetical protein AVDCRST_MAG85-928 [uncultured Solirubrobacteraceae bacterium]|uniref:RDD domain-containing protein n=1 Tax=uncultured Solirubrobacteraceae bacterium TaxID=1162706 RepID=A0A6J4S5B7_9ACTN|nr:MAG: hypothetical protein AVDCRST_MAG85-928 [uncultured Solirubrobacteraceae bacterium]
MSTPADRSDFARRVSSFLIDCGAALCTGLLAALVAQAAFSLSTDQEETIAAITVLVAWFVFVPVMTAVTRGQSLGKVVAATRVYRHDRPIGIGTSINRDVLARFIWVVPMVFLADSIWAAGADRQTLRDKVTDTYVLKEPGYGGRGVIAAVLGVGSIAGWFGLATLLNP